VDVVPGRIARNVRERHGPAEDLLGDITSLASMHAD